MMPITRETGSPRRLSRNARITGTPPATAASNKRSTPAASAAAYNSVPTLASNSLFAVTTGLPAARALEINSLAGSMPPIISTTRSTFGSATTLCASRVNKPSLSCTSRSRDIFRTATLTISRRTPVRCSMTELCCSTRRTKAAPTLPHPSTPMRTTLPCDSTVVTVIKAKGLSLQNHQDLATLNARGTIPHQSERGLRRFPGEPPAELSPRRRRQPQVSAPCCNCWPLNAHTPQSRGLQ